jgi:protein-tyrosine phosphatase
MPTTLPDRPIRRIITVCSGNICRSPIAHAMLDHHARKAGLSLMVLSMGTLDLNGQHAHPLAVECLREIGIPLGHHRSQGVSIGLLAHADLVLVMATEHQKWLARHGFTAMERVVVAGTLDPLDGRPDVEDPVDGTLEDFVACRERLERIVTELVHQISSSSVARAQSHPSSRSSDG